MSLGFIVNLGILINIYSILAISFNITLGYTGLINLGHIAFYAIGGYTSAILSKGILPVYLSIPLGGIVAMLFSFGLTYFIRKLKGDYLAMATLSFAFVVNNILLNYDSLTSGTLGITAIARPFLMKDNLVYLIFVMFINILVILWVTRIIHSPFGTLLQAVRDDEVLLRNAGKNSLMLKIKAMSISGFLAGIAGALFAHYISYIHPGFFDLNEIIIVLTIVIIGGLASLKGTIVATFLIVLLPELIRLFDIPTSIMGPSRQILYGMILLIILRFNSRGLFGKIDLNDY